MTRDLLVLSAGSSEIFIKKDNVFPFLVPWAEGGSEFRGNVLFFGRQRKKDGGKGFTSIK